jgi:glycosyltransferase involved in cell wall biosynthesis
MKKKEIFIDLGKLKVFNCGLGQTAYNYGIELGKLNLPKVNFNLLTPKNFNGTFGNNVNYIDINLIYRHFSFLGKKFDLWHSTNQLTNFMPSRSKTPVIYTIHDLNFLYEPPTKSGDKLFKKIQDRVNDAALITTISEFVADDIKKHLNLNGKEVRVVYNGVRLNNPEKTTKPTFVSNEIPFFFSIGQIVRKKNFHVLVDMMKYFPEKNLYICGDNDGDYADEIRTKIKEDSIKNIIITSSITNEEKNWLYQNCEAFVFPSKVEGFGLPVIEAMQCGKPVFSSQLTSLKEIGSTYAYFWDNFEALHMADVVKKGLKHFQDNPNLKFEEIKYTENYTYQKHTEKYLAIYHEILGLNYNGSPL